MRSLTGKLILGFLIVGLTGTVLLTLSVGLITTQEFGNFLFDQGREDFVSQLSEYYRSNETWEGVEGIFPFLGLRGLGGRPPNFGEGRPFTLVDSDGKVVVPGPGHHLGGMIETNELSRSEPIEVDGTEVGHLIVGRGAFRESRAAELFIERLTLILILGLIGATIVAVLLGIVIARSLTNPLAELTKATRAVAEGDLDQNVAVRSNDELGELAVSFNLMNANLARARDRRRQMTADIAHELRTPLSVILGHTEGIRDSVLEPSQEVINIVHEETLRLSSLVEDLRMLSLAEAGKLSLEYQAMSPEHLLKEAEAAHLPRAKRKKISIELKISPNLDQVNVDPGRIAQVLGNLIDNALRYTPEGGIILLQAEQSSDFVELRVQDSGPGIEAEELEHLFERFYREDESRQRAEGGSGLGLAIAKSIVEDHGGHIRAESDPGQGLSIIIQLPR
jgi:signal transduction histidine kinase